MNDNDKLLFNEDQMRAAFFKTFRGVGERWFPYVGMSAKEDEINAAVENEWREFLENLKNAS